VRGDLIKVCKHLKRGCKEDGSRLFPVVPSDRTRGCGHKLKPKKVPLNIRRYFLAARVTKQWHRLPSEVAGCPSLKIFKKHLDMFLGN